MKSGILKFKVGWCPEALNRVLLGKFQTVFLLQRTRTDEEPAAEPETPAPQRPQKKGHMQFLQCIT